MIKNNAIWIDSKDNVVIVLSDIKQGEEICYAPNKTIEAMENIPMYHKVAIIDIIENSSIIKYGEIMGVATVTIKKGSHVHCHNVKSRSSNEL